MTLPIFLLTDFGTRDTYVGQMKAVILGIAPGAPVVDLTHDVQPFDVAEGAWLLETALPALPERCVVLAVVDPGVGTARRPIVVASDGRTFVGPDNGLLSGAFPGIARTCGQLTGTQVYELANAGLRRGAVSDTFHGRDIFAPAAAHFAAGTDPRSAGPELHHPVLLPPFRAERGAEGELTGEVIHVDQFGTAVTTIRRDELPGRYTVQAGPTPVEHVGRTFADVSPGEALTFIDSSGYLAVAVNQGSAAGQLGLRRGSPVTVWPR
jgi:hypothetical protein